MPNLILERAGPERRETLANMFQFYVYDFSEQWGGEPRGEMREDGRFDHYDRLESYWTEASREPWLVRVNACLAGFVLLNGQAHSGRPVDWNMAEFFIVRKHRRGGAGTAAAHAAFAAHPGQWELGIARTNLPARSFWPRVIASAPGVSAIETIDLENEEWSGPVLRFRIG